MNEERIAFLVVAALAGTVGGLLLYEGFWQPAILMVVAVPLAIFMAVTAR
jgi:hypothetical protein